MPAISFDTLSAARELESAGFTREQAEAAAKTMRDAAGADRAELATKADIAAAIAELKADMLKVAIGVAFGIVFANAALTFALLRLIP